MRIYAGKKVNSGTVIAPAFVIADKDITVQKVEIDDITGQVERFNSSVLNLVDKLNRSKTDMEVNGQGLAVDIVNTHIMLLTDDSEESIIKRTEQFIRLNNVNAEYALTETCTAISESMEKGESEYLRARSEDVGHLSRMLVKELSENNESLDAESPKIPSIIVASELSPETLASIEPSMILGMVTRKGSPLSHTAILAANMNIPYITGVETDNPESLDGKTVAIDGLNSGFIVEPDKDMIALLEEQKESEKLHNAAVNESASKLIEDCPIKLYANIGKPEEAAIALEKGALGIGLMRSEFLYMNRDSVPGEEEQYDAYVSVLDTMGDKPVIVRTIDIGADKKSSCVKLPREENPALGTRGIRISFQNPELFKVQLRALLRAAYGRNLKIMFPMISSEWEVRKAINNIDAAASELEEEGKEYSVPPIGIMVETPAAVLILDQIAPFVSFVSIGTNDLTQYTLALDRVGDNLSEYFDPHHEAVLKLIQMTARTAHRYGIEVGICGELGGDTELSKTFLEYGIDELSMSPGKISEVAFELKGQSRTVEEKIEVKSEVPDIAVLSPVDGRQIPMEDIPDETFASGIMGRCVGIYPENGVITAPFDGEITMVAETKHALCIKSLSGEEILIHVGIDTVRLKGNGFVNELKVGDRIEEGGQLMEFDIDVIKDAGLSPMVIVIRLEQNS